MAATRKFHPACTVKLQIRLEDYGRDVDENVPTEDLPFDEQLGRLRRQERTLLDEIGKQQASGTRVGAPKLRAKLLSVRGQILTLQERAPQARAISEQVGDPYSVEIITVPIDSSAELNSYRALDTAKLKIPFRDAPLESQDVRSAIVEVYLGTVPAEDFTTPDRWRLALDRRNILFRGYVDNWDTDHDAEDASVELSCRSMECVLHDEKLDPRSRVFRIPKGGETISAFINRVLANVPATSGRSGGDQLKAIFYRANSEPRLDAATLLRGLQTVKSQNESNPAAAGVFPAEETGGTPSGAAAATAEVRLPPAHAQDMRAWDLIVQACEIVGCVPIYDPSLSARSFTLAGADDGGERQAVPSDFILVRPANTLYETVDQGTRIAGGSADAFERSFPSLGGAKPSQVRFMVWSRNITKLSTRRKLGRIKAPAVEVVSYNPDAPPAERVLRTVYPNAKVVTRRGAKGEGAKREVVRKIVYGVRSLAALEAIAVGLYHSIGRNELAVEIVTDDMTSYVDPSGTEENPDMLTLRSGTPCRVVVARQSAEKDDITLSPLSEIAGRNPAELRRVLLEQQERYRPGSSDSSRAALVERMIDRIVTTIQSGRRTDVFYVRTIKHNWSADDGWTATISLVNFVEARALPKNISSNDAAQDDKQRLAATVAKTRAFIASGRVRRSQGKP